MGGEVEGLEEATLSSIILEDGHDTRGPVADGERQCGQHEGLRQPYSRTETAGPAATRTSASRPDERGQIEGWQRYNVMHTHNGLCDFPTGTIRVARVSARSQMDPGCRKETKPVSPPACLLDPIEARP